MDMGKNTNDEKIERYKSDDEIDLVDILAVLIKRKWIIIILIVLSFVLSFTYVKIHHTKSLNYKVSIITSLPEVYVIKNDYILGKRAQDTSLFIYELNQKINQYKTNNDGLANIVVTTIKNRNNVNISIDAKSKNSAKEASFFIYKIYKSYKKTTLNKNKKLFELAQASLDHELEQKSAILNMLMKNINNDSSKNINGAIIYIIDSLSNDVSNIKRIKALNQEVLLNEGKIEISDGTKQLILNDSTISNIKNYIKPETPSKKKRLLPIIISVFLALFVGIFLAFVIEFFSREDVKARLKEASKK